MMNPETFLQHISENTRALIEAVTAAPEATVAACPGWTNRDLAKHMGNVCAFMTAQLRAANPQARAAAEAPAAPEKGDITGWLQKRCAEVMATLRATAPDAPAWTWVPNKTAAFFFRRLAHEIAVHRWDAQHAAGTLTPMDPDLAADGVHEVIEVFLQHRARGPYPSGSLHLHRTDGAGEWMLRAADGTLTVTHEHAKGDAAARGSAPALLLYLWGRGRQGLECHGDAALLDAWGAMTP
jgi:uncharacterized protein (TIGR03083 family)